jgi:hypothetical protein
VHAVDRVFQNTEGQPPSENAGERFALNKACSVAHWFKNKPMLSVEEARKPDVPFPSQLPLRPNDKNSRMEHHGVRPGSFGKFNYVAFAKLSIQPGNLGIPRWVVGGCGENLPDRLRRTVDQHVGFYRAVAVQRE